MSVKLIVQEFVVSDQVTDQAAILKLKRHPCLQLMVNQLGEHDLTMHGPLLHNLGMILQKHRGVVYRHILDITFEFESQEDLTAFVLAWS